MVGSRALFSVALLVTSMGLHATSTGPKGQAQPRRIEIIAKKFAFVPSEITVTKGQPVVLVLQSEDVLHGIRFKDLNLDTDIRKDAPSELSFTPEKTGTFIGRCSRFCGKGHGEMTLTLHVTE